MPEAPYRRFSLCPVAELRLQHPQPGARLFKLVNKVKHIAGRAETIEFHRHQFIARPDEFEDGGKPSIHASRRLLATSR
jgi:hypothetical protein